MNADLTKEGLGREGFVLYQNKDGFRFGTDSVLLAWFAASLTHRRSPVRILELGAGCGGASMCLAARLQQMKIEYKMDLIEIDPESFEILNKNIEANGLSDRVTAYCCDVRQMPDDMRNTQSDIVFANPPYYPAGSGETSPDARRNLARVADDSTYDDFAKAAASRLIPSGGLYTVVIDAAFLGKMMASFKTAGINISRVLPVYPSQDKKARLALIAGRRRGNEDTKVLPALYLNDKDAMRRIYEEEHKDCFI